MLKQSCIFDAYIPNESSRLRHNIVLDREPWSGIIYADLLQSPSQPSHNYKCSSSPYNLISPSVKALLFSRIFGSHSTVTNKSFSATTRLPRLLDRDLSPPFLKLTIKTLPERLPWKLLTFKNSPFAMRMRTFVKKCLALWMKRRSIWDNVAVYTSSKYTNHSRMREAKCTFWNIVTRETLSCTSRKGEPSMKEMPSPFSSKLSADWL